MRHRSQKLRLVLRSQHQLFRSLLQYNFVLMQFFSLGGQQLIRSYNLPVAQQIELEIADDQSEEQAEHQPCE
ncbi:hypothetical protein D3C71_2172930 [compost metagenome]